jgi:hypothetical protein
VSDWWEVAYKGGPMVAVKGFPRPLYPPDAAEHGKKPSMNGPDVEAYKRTVSRAGRWPWQEFDEAYSNGFAHGTGPNVIDTGVAGVQRQQDIDDSGWLGKATFNTLRSIRVPDGKPHAGEMAMDGYAADLINEAWDLFGGSEPDDQGDTLRVRALNRAKGQLGYVEGANNANKYGDWYGMNYQPYCAMFATWCYENEGDSPSFVRGSRYSYVPYIVNDAREKRYGLKTTDDPVAGDLVCYDFQGDGLYDHVGLFERWTASDEFDAVEANTSPQGSSGSQSNGGGVYRRTRYRSSQVTTFVRAAEP